MKKNLWIITMLIIVSMVFVGCGKAENNSPSQAEDKPEIITQDRTGQQGVFDGLKTVGGVNYASVKEGEALKLFTYEAGVASVIEKDLKAGDNVLFTYYKDANNKYVISQISKS